MLIPPSAVERAMQIKEVLLRAMNKEYSWLWAAEILGITPRGLRRLRQRMERFGYQGLVDMRRGRPSPRRTPVVEIERILQLYRERYSGFNARHFFATVRREHGVKLSYTCVKQLLQGAGLIKKRRARGRHRRRRERRARFGEMLHLDGSRHAWLVLVPEEKQTLIQVVDDAGGDDGNAGGGPGARHPRVVLHGPSGVGLRHSEGWGQGEHGAPDPGRRGAGSAGDRAHPVVLAAGSRPLGADEPHVAGPARQRAEGGRSHPNRGRQ